LRGEERANGRFGVAEHERWGEKIGAPMVLLLFALFRAGFEPLSWRRSSGIEGRSIFLGGIATHAVAQNRRGLA
jgi:hypothetical protein